MDLRSESFFLWHPGYEVNLSTNSCFDTAKSGNIMVTPKNFTVRLALTSDPAKFKIFRPWESVQDSEHASIWRQDQIDTGEAKLSLYQMSTQQRIISTV